MNERHRRMCSERQLLKATSPQSNTGLAARRSGEQLLEYRTWAKEAGLAVELNDSGWLRAGPAIQYEHGPNKTLRPLKVLITSNTNIATLTNLDIPGRCERYNTALAELRILREKITELMSRLYPNRGSLLWTAQDHLLAFEKLLAQRQAERMSGGIVFLETLDSETTFWKRYHGYFAEILAKAECSKTSSA